jgi:E3 ubiquitin-protein ligase FANCL
VWIRNIKEQTDHSVIIQREKSSWKVIEHHLPLSHDIFPTNTNLLGIIRVYLLHLENLQPFYSSLQTLDDICVVGEPEIVTAKSNWRLVKFSNDIFIRIEFTNPLNVDQVSVSFHGKTNLVREMTETFEENWKDHEDDDNTIYDKLLNIFNIPYFPATDEDTIDCSICLCYRCENNRCPVVCCENEKCDSTFHISCLEKYLKVQKHVTVLSICIGECPFCKQKLSNSYASFFQRILEK